MNAAVRRPALPPHAFQPDDAVPPDWAGRRTCVCGKPGEEGDQQHPVGALPLGMPTLPPLAPEVLEHESRRIGERYDAA